MAFRKKAMKTYQKGRKAYKFAKTHQSEAKKALALAKKVARIVNTEYKYDLTASNINPDWTGTIINLCNPSQGLLTTNRVGASIKPMKLSGKLAMYINSLSDHTHVRVILFRGKNEGGAATPYTPTDILDNTTGGQFFLAPKNPDNIYNTKFIYDKTYTLSSQGRQSLVLKYDFKLFGHIKFTQGGVGATIENGGIYMLVVTNEPTNTPNFVSTLRVTYVDN